ncbi:MAG: hypothetical protein R3A80_13795 [Bdellovibrionota bacterium]
MAHRKTRNQNAGFTILEVLAATLIFFLVIASVIATRTRALRSVAESRLISQAQTLATMKMTEMEIKFQDAIDKTGIKGSLGKEEGSFDAPYETFRWNAEFKENPITIEQDQLLQFLSAYGISEEDAQAQFEQSKLLLTNLNKALKENMGELVVNVTWDFQKSERNLILVTHLIPKKPKIKFTQNADVGREFSP